MVGFAFVPFVSLLVPFMALPVIASATDSSGWASLAIGQSIGGLAALLVGFGWPLNGPAEIATGSPAQVGQTYYDSLVSRGVMLAFVLVPLVALTLMVAPAGHEVLAATMAAASAASAFSWNWVAVGLGRPRLIALYDVLPRAAFIVVAIAIILDGHALAWYPACLIASTAVSLALSVKRVVPPSRARRTHRQILARSLRHQLPYVATTTSAGAYTAASIFVVGLATTTQATAMTSSADRLYRIGLLATVALSSAFQAWVVHDDEQVARRRRLVALRSHAALAVIGGSAMAIMAPTVSRVLFGASLSPTLRVTAWYGVAFACVAISTSLGLHYLLPAGRRAHVLACTITGAVFGVPTVFLLARAYGSVGAAAGIGLSELLVVLLAALFTVTSERARRNAGEPLGRTRPR